MSDDHESSEERERLRRRRLSVLWTAGVLAVVAVGVYITFIIMMGQR